MKLIHVLRRSRDQHASHPDGVREDHSSAATGGDV